MSTPEPPQAPVYPPPPSAAAPPPASRLAIVALVVGVVAFLTGIAPLWGIAAGAAAVILGAVALAGRQSKGLALTGLILGAVATIASLGTTAILVITLVVANPPSGEAGPEPVGPPATPQDTSAPGAGGPNVCDPADVQVTDIVSGSAFQVGEFPMISLTVKSSAVEACTIEAGSDVQELNIMSGGEVIWTSKDCQIAPEPHLQVLQPGIPVATAPIAWDRTHSSPDTCSAEREQAAADGASYQLTVKVDDHESRNEASFLLT